MPCDSIVLATVVLKCENLELLKAALEARGYTVYLNAERKMMSFRNDFQSGSFANDRLTVPDTFDVNAIKRQYSHLVVQQQARKRGWTLKQTGDNKYVVTRRA